MNAELLAALQAASSDVVALPRSEEKDWFERWTQLYCQPLLRKYGRLDALGALRWHTFCHGTKCLEGAAALQKYTEIEPETLIVLVQTRAGGAFQLAKPRPIEPPGNLDFLLFPPSLEWTVAFTHEDLGPFYSEAEWCVDGF
jgi:hypothetical protein